MMQPRPTYRYDTLGAMIDGSYQIALYCERANEHGVSCGFVKWLDLPKLAAKLGRNHGCLRDDLVPHLWCTRCDSRNVAIRLHPPTLPMD